MKTSHPAHASHSRIRDARTADAVLIGAAADGDREALAHLYDRHARTLLALGQRMLSSRHESEDLLHDVFLEVWRHARDYDETRGSVRSWLCLRLRSRALDRLKSPLRTRGVSFEVEARDDASMPSFIAPTEVGPGPDAARVRGAIDVLPPDQRVVLELAYFEGRTLSEIAERHGVPVGTVKSRLARALGKLRLELDPGAETFMAQGDRA